MSQDDAGYDPGAAPSDPIRLLFSSLDFATTCSNVVNAATDLADVAILYEVAKPPAVRRVAVALRPTLAGSALPALAGTETDEPDAIRFSQLCHEGVDVGIPSGTGSCDTDVLGDPAIAGGQLIPIGRVGRNFMAIGLYFAEPGGSANAVEFAGHAAVVLGHACRHASVLVAVQRQQALLSALGHAVGNSLTAARLAAGILDRLDPADAASAGAEYLVTILDAVDEMDAFNEDVHLVRRLQDPEFYLRPTVWSAEGLIATAVGEVRASRPTNGLRIIVQCEPAAAAFGDRRLVLRALKRIFARAVAVSPADGRVTMSARTRSGAVIFAVSDEGPGDDGRNLGTMPDRFESTQPSVGRGNLELARSIVQALGGALWGEGEKGSGSTIAFTVPAAPTTPSAAPAHVPG